MCAAKLIGLGKPSLALDTPLVQILQVKYVPGSTLFHLWEVVQVFRGSPYFAVK